MTAHVAAVPHGVAAAGDHLLRAALVAAESGLVPDSLLRFGIRRFAAQRLRDEARLGRTAAELAAEFRRAPIAVHVDDANVQHYALPPAFFATVLGHRLKYSAAYWPAGVSTLDAAEDAMLELTCQRAGLRDGMSVLAADGAP